MCLIKFFFTSLLNIWIFLFARKGSLDIYLLLYSSLMIISLVLHTEFYLIEEKIIWSNYDS